MRFRYLIYFFLLLLFSSCVKEKTLQLPQFPVMGTLASLTLVVQHQNPYEILAQVKSRLNQLEKIFSRYIPDSEVSRFNNTQGTVHVSPELYELLQLALTTYQKTGVFEITLLPAIKLWDYKRGLIPNSDKLVSVKNVIGSQWIELKPNFTVLKKKPVMIDLGGIAKGYAVYQTYLLLKNAGITAGIIRIGGEIYAFGKEWKIGIADPQTKKPHYLLKIKDKAVSTSGDYERFFNHQGQTYSHILDPRTLRPAVVKAHGVTVIGDPVIDSIPTSLFILGPEKGLEILKKHYPAHAALYIMPDGQIVKSNYFPYHLEKITP